jgi:hypothetical protein
MIADPERSLMPPDLLKIWRKIVRRQTDEREHRAAKEVRR